MKKIPLSDYEKKIKGLSKERDLIMSELSRIESRKGELNYLNNRLSEMLDISNDTESKLSKISKDIVQVEQVEVKINNLNRIYSELSDKVNTLSQKDKDINDSIKTLKKTDSFMQTIETKLEEC